MKRGLWVAVSLIGLSAGAQTPSSNSAARSERTFEVVSVRQNQTGGTPHAGPTSDGYSATNVSVAVPLVTAFTPQTGGAALYTNDQVRGLPDWALRNHYDIQAKVSEEDLAQWQATASQTPMLQPMLQAMLASRFQLAVHREVKTVPVYSLVVAKDGPKFSRTNPHETHPPGAKLPGAGGEMVPENGGRTLHFFGVSMEALAPLLSGMAGRPVQDKTGLTGRYDLRLERPAPAVPPNDSNPAADPGPSIFSVLEGLGLKLEPAKGEVETLVVDHIERPSEN